MTNSNNPNDDSFIDPSRLKGERIDPAELIETLKQSDGVRWPGAIVLMLLTLAIGFALAVLLIFGRDAGAPTADEVADEPAVNQPIDDDAANEPSVVVETDELQAGANIFVKFLRVVHIVNT